MKDAFRVPSQEVPMSPSTETVSFLGRVIKSDIFRKGVAGAVGAVLTAAIAEALFPTES